MPQIRIFRPDAHFVTLSVRQLRFFWSDAHFFRPDAHFATLSVRQQRVFWSDAQMLFHCVTQHTFSTSGVTLNRLKWDSAHHFIHGSPTNLPAMGLTNQFQHQVPHSPINQSYLLLLTFTNNRCLSFFVSPRCSLTDTRPK